MKDTFPNFNAALAFWDQSSADYWMALQTAALRIGVRLVGVELHELPYDYERAIAGVVPEDRKFLVAMASPFFFLDRARLAELALRHGMAFISQVRPSVAAGALLSYGPDLNAMFALAANFLDRIAKGTKPIDLPVEQPTKFELVLNLKTAKALGLTVPDKLLAIADEAIE